MVYSCSGAYTTPVRGGFDTAHLQAIHHHLYQDLYDWAGDLRSIDSGNVPASQVEKSLDSVLDRLIRENHLKGLSVEEWANSASAYLYDLGAIQPFLAGNEIALHEFAVELARKNSLSLQWDATPTLQPTRLRYSAKLSSPQTCDASSCWPWIRTP